LKTRKLGFACIANYKFCLETIAASFRQSCNYARLGFETGSMV